MKTPEPPKNTSNNEDAEVSEDSPTEQGMIDFASELDDFMDEEVVDKQGTAIGTLACYWQSLNGLLVFLGIKLNEHESVRIVPGHRSQVDDRNACIRLAFDAADIESAPRLDCAKELDATIERAVYEHFRILETEPHGALRYFGGKS
jgi:hypothetical protein